MNFKLGDIVKVKNNLISGKTYGTYFNEEMEKFCGNKYKIVSIHKSTSYVYWYNLDGLIREENDSGYWDFTDEMLEPSKKIKFHK